MRFVIGRTYRHTTGETIKIVGSAHTHFHGWCLLSEVIVARSDFPADQGNIIPVGSDSDAYTANYEECTPIDDD